MLQGLWASGEIGRRAGFRCLYSKGCAGSSPASPTILTRLQQAVQSLERCSVRGIAVRGMERPIDQRGEYSTHKRRGNKQPDLTYRGAAHDERRPERTRRID
jgi:hypothetical protein